MCIFCACNLGSRVGSIWDKDTPVWWLGERIGRRNAVIFCRHEYHAKVAMIATYQGSWDRTHVGLKFIFEIVQCLICRFPTDSG